MPRPQHQHQGRPQHLPHCKYYQGEPPANAAIFDVRSQQDETQTEAPHSRLQLQRLPALTIRRQLQVQWGPTVSLPQPGESPPPGPPPGHNVRLFEVRHSEGQADASARTAAAAPSTGQTFVVQKQTEARSGQQTAPLTRPLKPVDVSPLRELPPEQPPARAPPQQPPPVLPSPPPHAPSPPRRSSPPHQTTRAKPPSRSRPGRHTATKTTRGQPLAVTRGSRGVARSRVAAASVPNGRTRVAARSPSRRSPTRRRPQTRGASPRVGTGATTAHRSTLVPSARPPDGDAAQTTPTAPRRAPARVDIAVTSLPSSVQGGLTHSAQPAALFRELSASAEARRVAGIPIADFAGADNSADGPLGAEHEANLFGEMSMTDRERLSLVDEADGGIDTDADLWSTAQRIRRQQEVTDIEHRVLDLIGAKVVAGLLNMDRKGRTDKWSEHHRQQPFLSNEVDAVGEHTVLGEGISMEEREIRTPINYDDYLDQEPENNEVEFNRNENGGSIDGGSLDYEDDFEDEEEEANHQETPPVVGDTREKELEDQKSASVPEIQIDSESLKDDKSGQGTPEVEAAGDRPPPSPEPAAPSPVRAPSPPRRFSTVRIRSRRTGGVTTVSLPLPLPTPVSSPDCSRPGPGPAHRVVTPERSLSPRGGEGGSGERVPTPPPSPDHSRERVSMYRWRSRIEAPPAPPMTPPESPPPASIGAFSFTPEATSPRCSPPLPTLASAGVAVSGTPAKPPHVDAEQQTSGKTHSTEEAPPVPAGRGHTLGASLTSSSSLGYSSSLSSNLQVQSQDSLSWGEVRLQRDVASSADTQLSQGEVPPGAVQEPAGLCSSLSEGEVVGQHRCSRAASSLQQGKAVPGRSFATSTAAGSGIGNGGNLKDRSEGEISMGPVPAVLPYGMADDTDSTSVSDTS